MSVVVRLISLSLLLITLNARAEVFQCVGMDKDGKAINVIFDSDALTINIDGTVHKVDAPTVGTGVATENYISSDGTNVYVSLIVNKNYDFILSLINADTNVTIGRIYLSCHER